MSIFRLDKRGRVAGIRCDWCGKIANNRDGEYARPVVNEFGVALAGYIHRPGWPSIPDTDPKDICDECREKYCRYCGAEAFDIATGICDKCKGESVLNYDPDQLQEFADDAEIWGEERE